MGPVEASNRRVVERTKALKAWASQHDVDLKQLDDGQRWVVYAALQFRSHVGPLSALLRLLAYVLAHSGMAVPAPVIASLAGVSDRAVRTTKALAPDELLHSVRTPPRGRGKPKLGPEQAGTIAKFLVEHRDSEVNDVLAFIRTQIGVAIDRKTLRVFIARYGLGCLREDAIDDRPLFSEPPGSEGPSS
jgi:hypothetical protein